MAKLRSSRVARQSPVIERAKPRVDLGQLRRKVNLSQEEMARLLGTSWVTVSRWERKRAVPRSDARARLHRLQRLLERIGDSLPEGELLRFLLTPHPLLRGYKPADLLQSDYSFEDLVNFVESAKSGDMT